MDRDKSERLRSKGWRFGNAADFLELTEEESIYIEVKIQLCRALRDRRKDNSLTQAQLAARIGSSQSRVAKMEAGDPTVSLDLLTRSLIALGATRLEISRLIATTD